MTPIDYYDMEDFINRLAEAVQEIDLFGGGVESVSTLFYILVDLPFVEEAEYSTEAVQHLLPLAKEFSDFTLEQELIFTVYLAEAIHAGRFKRADS